MTYENMKMRWSLSKQNVVHNSENNVTAAAKKEMISIFSGQKKTLDYSEVIIPLFGIQKQISYF